ncbi:cupin domain-containing protein [Streptomyces sp. NBC_01439]|uniref:cupin domain-containing protein n=1 Tax=Streptomyces sp. NBC_01439 TaxID=2903867 RepID=UPI002E290BE6|nr:cupin domain-containing protein [Streptomyces sp. NBC_01439]
MIIRRREPDNLTRAHGLDLGLLHPWPGLETPFRGAWCVLRPGDVTDAHAHHERELFIVMAGRAAVVCEERRHELAAGDLAVMRAGAEHHIVNEHDEDFAYYAIWWGPDMSADFLAVQPESEPESEPVPEPGSAP